MKPINLNKAIPELEEQLAFLISTEFYKWNKIFRKIALYLFSTTVIIIGIATLTHSNTLISFKAVSLILLAVFWLAAISFLIPNLIKRYKREIWKQKTLKNTFENDSSFQFLFDEEGLHYITDQYDTKIKWDYYKYYAINKNSIFIFHSNSIYDALYYSKNELGQENYEQLKAIASEKLMLTANGNDT